MTNFQKPRFAATAPLCLLSALFLTGPVAAQTVDTLHADTAAEPGDASTLASPTSDANNVFPSAYFDVYVPRTALDMIQRIPGFQVRTGDTGRRGLGQGGANILINGERLTGKTNAFDQLDQILASNVVEIRIRDGASLAIPGLSGQVADVIVKRGDKLSGTWEWNPQFRKRLEPNLLNGEVNLSGEIQSLGDLSYTLTLREYGFWSGARATETLRNPSGVIFETRDEDIQNIGDNPGIGINLGWTPRPDHKANLNAEYFLFNYNRASRAVRTPLTVLGDDSFTTSAASEDEWNLEIDGDYEFPLFSGKLKLTGVLDRESSPTSRDFFVNSPDIGFTGASRFDQEAEEKELIGRAEYSWSPSEGRDWQIAGELAYNELDVEQELFLMEPGHDFVGQGLSGFNVSEDRAEATITHNRPFGPKIDLQASAGVEYSKLMQEQLGGLNGQADEFVRPKGFVSATYKVDDSLNVRARLEREVGQLNFFDFVASVDLEDDLDRSANFDLVPDQSWLASLEFDKDFGQGNTIRVEFYGAAISDTVDRIPVGTDGDAIGNIDKAYRYGVDVISTLKGDQWGLTGTELNLEFNWRDSTVDDPLLGFSRRLNDDKEIYYEASFRHDIPQTDWAYGFYLERYISADRYTLFSIERFGVDKPFTSVFVEHKDIAGMTLRASLRNLIDQEEFFERTRFTARRDVGVVQQFETIKYDYGPILSFSLSGDF